MFFRNKNSHYKEEVKSRNRLGEITSSINVLLDQVKGKDEKTFAELSKIAAEIETEVFVQGALCTCFSGQCYLSSFAGGNSGNRGLCKQPCRKIL